MTERSTDCICHCRNHCSDRCLTAEVKVALAGLQRAVAACDAQGLSVYVQEPDLGYMTSPHRVFMGASAIAKLAAHTVRTVTYE